MTTKEDYIKLCSLEAQVDNKIKKKEEIIHKHLMDLDYLQGNKNGIGMVRNMEQKGIVNDKKPETLGKLVQQLKSRIEIFNNSPQTIFTYPATNHMNKDFTRGQIMGIYESSKILFNFDPFKALNLSIDEFRPVLNSTNNIR